MLGRKFAKQLIMAGLLALVVVPVQAEQAGLTAASHGIDLPGGLADRIPFPANVDMGGQREIVGSHYVNFRFSLASPEAVVFFAAELPAAGWQVTREELPE